MSYLRKLGRAFGSKLRASFGSDFCSFTAIIPLVFTQLYFSQQAREQALSDGHHRLDLLASLALLTPAPTVAALRIGPDKTFAAVEAAASDRSAYGELERLLGPLQVSRWLNRLHEQLAGILVQLETTRPDRTELARQAHGLVSHAGSLGFRRVAEACRLLEEACVENQGELQSRVVDAQAASLEGVDILSKLTGKMS